MDIETPPEGTSNSEGESENEYNFSEFDSNGNDLENNERGSGGMKIK